MAQVSEVFGMKSVVGSAWRPQSQGTIESSHRRLTNMLKIVTDKYPDTWDVRLPYCVWAWRVTPQPALGGLSPYRITTSMQPRTPFSFTHGPVGKRVISPGTWVAQVMEQYEQTMRFVREFHRESRESKEKTQARSKRVGSFEVGDFVLVLRPDSIPHVSGLGTQTSNATVSQKLLFRTFDGIYVVYQKSSETSFRVKHASTGAQPTDFENPVHLHRLLPVRLWETKDPNSESATRRLVIRQRDGAATRTAEVISHGYLGHVRVRYEDDQSEAWLDLSKEEYSWTDFSAAD